MSTWLELLQEAIDTYGQAEVARRLGVSPAMVSMAKRGEYPASTDNIEAKVAETFGGKPMKKIPEGYIEDAKGRLIPVANIPAIDQQRDSLVREITVGVRELQEIMAASKRCWLAAIQAHIQIAAEQYGARVVGDNGVVTMTSIDGSIRVERQYSSRLIVNERGNIAKELVDRYVRTMSDQLPAETRRLVRAAFRTDDKGNYSATALLSLARRIKSDAPEWQQAVAAINDAVTTEIGDPYVRVYVRDERGTYNQIPLDFSAV